MILELCEKMEVNGKSMPQVSFPEGWELRLLGELATIFSGELLTEKTQNTGMAIFHGLLQL